MDSAHRRLHDLHLGLRLALSNRTDRFELRLLLVRWGNQDSAALQKVLNAQISLRCPPEYGPHMTIYNRFVRWARRGVWENMFRELARNGRSTDTR